MQKKCKKERDSKCRLYQQNGEARDYIFSVFPILAKEHYVRRHDRLCAHLHFNILKDKEHWYVHVTESAETNHENEVTVFWTGQV